MTLFISMTRKELNSESNSLSINFKFFTLDLLSTYLSLRMEFMHFCKGGGCKTVLILNIPAHIILLEMIFITISIWIVNNMIKSLNLAALLSVNSFVYILNLYQYET